MYFGFVMGLLIVDLAVDEGFPSPNFGLVCLACIVYAGRQENTGDKSIAADLQKEAKDR